MICAFCQREAKPTREHAIPLWMNGVLPPSDLPMRHSVTDRDEPERSRTWQAKKPDFVVKRLCDPCNTKRFSQLEGRAKPYLTPLIQGRGRTLHDTGRCLVASWAIKTVMVFQISEKANHTFIPPEHYHALYADQIPPPGIMVWFGAASDNAEDIRYASHSMHSKRPDLPPTAYGATLVIGHLVLHVVGAISEDRVQINNWEALRDLRATRPRPRQGLAAKHPRHLAS